MRGTLHLLPAGSDEGVTLWEDVPGPAVEAEPSRQASLRALV